MNATLYNDRWEFSSGGKSYRLCRETFYPDPAEQPWLADPALYAAEGEAQLFMPSLVPTGIEPMPVPMGREGITGCLSPEALAALHVYADEHFQLKAAQAAYAAGHLLGRVVNWLPPG